MYHRAAFHGRPGHLNFTRFPLAQNRLPSAPLHSHIKAVRLRILTRLPALSSHYAVIMIGTGHVLRARHSWQRSDGAKSQRGLHVYGHHTRTPYAGATQRLAEVWLQIFSSAGPRDAKEEQQEKSAACNPTMRISAVGPRRQVLFVARRSALPRGDRWSERTGASCV